MSHLGHKEQKEKYATPCLNCKIGDVENRNVKVFSGKPDVHYSKAIRIKTFFFKFLLAVTKILQFQIYCVKNFASLILFFFFPTLLLGKFAFIHTASSYLYGNEASNHRATKGN